MRTGQPSIGDTVTFVDSTGREHSALVTNEFSGGRTDEEWSVNVVFVNPDETMNDQYGRQLLRETSVPPARYQSAHGNYWKWA